MPEAAERSTHAMGTTRRRRARTQRTGDGSRFDSPGEFGDTVGVALLRRLLSPLTRLVHGAVTRVERPVEPAQEPAGPVLDTFEPAKPGASRAAPAPGPKSLAAAFRADSFSGFVDGFEPAARAPVDLRGDRAPIVPEVVEVPRGSPVMVNTGFSASLDDLLGMDDLPPASSDDAREAGPDDAELETALRSAGEGEPDALARAPETNAPLREPTAFAVMDSSEPRSQAAVADATAAGDTSATAPGAPLPPDALAPVNHGRATATPELAVGPRPPLLAGAPLGSAAAGPLLADDSLRLPLSAGSEAAPGPHAPQPTEASVTPTAASPATAPDAAERAEPAAASPLADQLRIPDAQDALETPPRPEAPAPSASDAPEATEDLIALAEALL
jgi:hypothetical protein